MKSCAHNTKPINPYKWWGILPTATAINIVQILDTLVGRTLQKGRARFISRLEWSISSCCSFKAWLLEKLRYWTCFSMQNRYDFHMTSTNYQSALKSLSLTHFVGPSPRSMQASVKWMSMPLGANCSLLEPSAFEWRALCPCNHVPATNVPGTPRPLMVTGWWGTVQC